MLSSSERQVRSAGCMLNTVTCKTNNWRQSFAELHLAAGQVEQVGICAALNPQLSVCHTMEMHAFNYVFKTLLSVPLLQVPPCACSAEDERCFSFCLSQLEVVLSFFLFLFFFLIFLFVAQDIELHLVILERSFFYGFISQRWTVLETPAESSSGCICMRLCMCPWPWLSHPSLLLHPFMQVLSYFLGHWASWSPQKLWTRPFSKHTTHVPQSL